MASESKYPWPEWQLTAYVLDELAPEIAGDISRTMQEDAALAAEIASIRATLDQVKLIYRDELTGITASQPPLIAPPVQDVVRPLADSSDRPQSAAAFGSPRRTRFSWIGLLGMAASLAVAAYLGWTSLNGGFHLGPQYTMKRNETRTASQQTSQEQSHASEDKPSSAIALSSPFTDQLGQGQSAAQPTAPASVRTNESLAERPRSRANSTAPEWAKAKSSSSAPGTPANMSMGMGAEGGMMSGHSEGMAGGMDGGYGAMGMGMDMGMEMGYGGGGMGGMGDAGMGMPMGGMGMVGGMDELGIEQRSDATALAGMSDGETVYFREDAFGRRFYDVPAEEGRRSHLGMPIPRPGFPNNDRYAPIYENGFTAVNEQKLDSLLSTFSIDVDTASYVKTRQFLLESRRLPPANAVRIEEFINYFDYEYAGPNGDAPFAADLGLSECPWQPEHKLVRIALQATKMDVSERPQANIVFLLDVSGSMNEPNKLPLVKESMRMLIQQLGENDRVAMVVYAGAAGCVLESTRGDQQQQILAALDRLQAGGSTNGGQGIQLAYDLARDHFIPGGINRVILCTDGDFNVGVTSTDALVNLVVENAKSKVFLTVLGYGMGNTNDAMMEQISNKGNGVYSIVDSRREAQRQMVQQLAGNLMTVAKDVKIQVEFNPRRVAAYRLIGYENRKLNHEDFANDKKDAGEIGAGHRVTALYEIVPVGGRQTDKPAGEELRYGKKKNQATEQHVAPENNDVDSLNRELLAVKLRYKQPEGDTSRLLTFPLQDRAVDFEQADRDFRWAAAVAQFGMLLRHSQYKGNATWENLMELAEQAAGVQPDAARQECLTLMRIAGGLRH